MKKKNKLIISLEIFIIILILLLYLILILNKKYNSEQNIFVLTVDDIKLSTSQDISNTELVVELLQKHNISATFFAIPSEMKEYSFPDKNKNNKDSITIEIAQHGYDHYNEKLDSYKEFKGLSINESKKLIIEGKIALEYYGYNVAGFRAPCLYLDKDLIAFLKENYEYDSSFLLPNNKFSIPILLDDPTQFVCSTNGCNKLWLSIRKKWLFFIMNINDLFNNPNVLLMHSQGMTKLMQDENGRAFLNAIFTEINKRNYNKMTMQEYNKIRKEVQ